MPGQNYYWLVDIDMNNNTTLQDQAVATRSHYWFYLPLVYK